jgi:phosphoenolpyruvate-protein kinase (PTS system EI component)
MRRVGDTAGIAAILRNMGQVAQREGNYAEAVQLFRESLEIFERQEMPEAEEVRKWLQEVEEEMASSG